MASEQTRVTAVVVVKVGSKQSHEADWRDLQSKENQNACVKAVDLSTATDAPPPHPVAPVASDEPVVAAPTPPPAPERAPAPVRHRAHRIPSRQPTKRIARPFSSPHKQKLIVRFPRSPLKFTRIYSTSHTTPASDYSVPTISSSTTLTAITDPDSELNSLIPPSNSDNLCNPGEDPIEAKSNNELTSNQNEEYSTPCEQPEPVEEPGATGTTDVPAPEATPITAPAAVAAPRAQTAARSLAGRQMARHPRWTPREETEFFEALKMVRSHSLFFSLFVGFFSFFFL